MNFIILQGRHLDPSIYLMNDENKAPSNDPDKSSSSKETNSSGDVTSEEAGSSSNTKETEDTATEEPHSQAEAMTASVEDELSEKAAQCKIDGIVFLFSALSLASCEVSLH